MKNFTKKYLILAGLFLFLMACSTKKNTFLSRNYHALTTKYNILYNGDIALEKGIEDIKLQYSDNFWERLPVERLQINEEELLPGETKNADFDRAEDKAAKAIQKHSIYIQGSEKNFQTDEAYFLLGKARYYGQRFIPAIEAFNYVLYKYPSSNKIYQIKIWREKTNMRLENDQLAVNNLRKLLKEIKFKDQIFADANATLAQAFLNLAQKDSAVVKLKLALDYTKLNEEKARYKFILGQIYDELGHKDSAAVMYYSVIDMKRKAQRQYVIHSHIRLAKHFDYEKGDTTAFIAKYNKLLEDRENRPFLDFLHHQMGLFYDKKKNVEQAKSFYNKSLRDNSIDKYLIASNYRNLADINFNAAKYSTAGNYFDSTLVQLKPRTREYNLIKKKRENLEDVIKYEGIAKQNDSIIFLYGMSESAKKSYFEKFILELKKQDEKLKKSAEKEAIIKENLEKSDQQISSNGSASKSMVSPVSKPISGTIEDFYFYNAATVAYGKKEFIKNWGKRTLQDNWRRSSSNNKSKIEVTEEDSKEIAETSNDSILFNEKYTTEFYIAQLPTSQKVIDSLTKDRNFAYYQLGIIYKEKFKEYNLAASKLEQLLNKKPEERLVLPAMYNLYKIYELIDKNKAVAMKSRITTEYPSSRYAQIINNPNAEIADSTDSPKYVYEQQYKKYLNGEYKAVLIATEQAIDRYTGDEIVPKFELLKANIIGKLKGLDEYKKALNFVALNYSTSEQGKSAEQKVAVDVPKLAALQLSKNKTNNWKILYKTKDEEEKNTTALRAKIEKFIADRSFAKLRVSVDIYTMTDNFLVIHGLTSEDIAKEIVSILKEYKDYQVQEKGIIITSENYVVVQIKKNLDDYLAGKLVENPPLPNWDGTTEKEPVAEKSNQSKNQNQSQSQKKLEKDNGPPMMLDVDENTKNSGLPQSSQPKKSGKKE